MNSKYLQELYREGFVPGPEEDVITFEKRVTLVKGLISSPETFLKELKISFDAILPITPYFLSITRKKKLPFWFGAMTWIYEHEGVAIPILELPKEKRGFSLSQSDIISHEQVHFLRATFKEPKFEEILAYHTSKSPWRRYLGPIFQKPWESYLFLALCCLLPFFPSLGLLITLPLIRLALYQWIFRQALKKLSLLYTNEEEVITLFTDKEIIKTAFSKYDAIDKTSLRWKLIEQIALL